MDEIRQHDRQEGRTMGWHGKTIVNPELALDNCHMREWDYVPMRLPLPNGKPSPFWALGVTDECMVPELDENDKETGNETPLIVGKAYSAGSFKPVTNKRLLDLMTEATAGKDLVLESCGTVKNRGRQFLSFRLGEGYRAAGREFVPFLNVGNGNDQSSPLWDNTSATCTVCDNTFNVNMNSKGLIMSVKKTKFSEFKVGDVAKSIRAMLKEQAEFARAIEALGLMPASTDTAADFFAGFLGEPGKAMATRTANTVDRLLELFKSGAGNEGKNFADIFQALTDYYTHESAGSNEDSGWKNYVSSEFGNARNEKVRAWNTLNTKKLLDGTLAFGREILKLTAANK